MAIEPGGRSIGDQSGYVATGVIPPSEQELSDSVDVLLPIPNLRQEAYAALSHSRPPTQEEKKAFGVQWEFYETEALSVRHVLARAQGIDIHGKDGELPKYHLDSGYIPPALTVAFQTALYDQSRGDLTVTDDFTPLSEQLDVIEELSREAQSIAPDARLIMPPASVYLQAAIKSFRSTGQPINTRSRLYGRRGMNYVSVLDATASGSVGAVRTTIPSRQYRRRSSEKSAFSLEVFGHDPRNPDYPLQMDVDFNGWLTTVGGSAAVPALVFVIPRAQA
jgi:hypothetical protein